MNRKQLIETIEAGQKLKYIFFWGHTPRADGSVDATCFSQWYRASFTIDDIEHRTAEHYMMAEKARLFGDIDTLHKIVSCTHPGEAKQLGRQVRGFDQATWAQRRTQIVVQGNRARFEQNLALGEFLLATGDRVIVEASPRDIIWGIGLDKNNPQAQDPSAWRGENLLGFALMQVRALLRDGE